MLYYMSRKIIQKYNYKHFFIYLEECFASIYKMLDDAQYNLFGRTVIYGWALCIMFLGDE